MLLVWLLTGNLSDRRTFLSIIFRFIRTFSDWPECECVQVNHLKCSGASYTILYPEAGDHTSVLSITIPALMSADPANWNLTVYLDLTFQPDSVSSTHAKVTLSAHRLSSEYQV